MRMENMQFAEELVREFLVFRGFTETLKSFGKELGTDIGKGFEVDKILDLIFSGYIPKFEAEKLIDLLSFFKRCFSHSDTTLFATLSRLEQSILRYYIVNAIKYGRKDKVMEFLGIIGNDLLQRDQNWSSWFAIPYIQNPHLDPQFRVYFSEEWFRSLHLSVRNFLTILRTPALLKIRSERNTANHLMKENKKLNLKLSQLQTLLEEKEAQLCHSRSASSAREVGGRGTGSFSHPIAGAADEAIFSSSFSDNILVPDTSLIDGWESFQNQDDAQFAESHSSRAHAIDHPSEGRRSDADQMFQNDSIVETCSDVQGEKKFPEVKAVFQDTFLGHTSPISCCRFSATGDNIASASMDGTVRIWTYDSTAPASKNATIYCGAEIMSLEWDCKSDRLLLIGTADGGIKAWNVDAKRVVCDLNSAEAYPSVLDLKCSPVEPIFVSAAASRRQGTSYYEKLGFASLTVWNMRTWKAMAVLPLGKDPPAITSLCFNHNGKLLAAAATDGMIHMFDMSAGLQVTGWPAHDSAIGSVLFGPDETSIFSLGTDGKIIEWSLQSQGKILWSIKCNRFYDPYNSSQFKHELALDANGRRLLVTSNSVSAPIHQVRGHMSGMRTLSHSGPITTVDWHPTLPIFLTGSADHSVRVTSIS
ncbi:WD REPEATS REGION domain-containing protein [Abeliophyllum distichum]|uniref:WD REPEATS REGION domain-containing protein n=1 Tax=Abeliophyllum distichum TaxID=126358 RepID=A0ABD1VY22_9LAMI